MNQRPDPLTAYNCRRAILEAQLVEVKSRAATQQIELAVFATDVAVATLHDLEQSMVANAAALKATLARQQSDLDASVAQLHAATAGIRSATTDVDVGIGQFQAALSVLSARSSLKVAEVKALEHELIQFMGVMWLNLMQSLFESDDRRIFFARLEKIFDAVIGKVPAIGDYLEAMKAAADVRDIRTIEARDADAYMLSLESYLRAANAYVNGVIGYCEASDRLLSGRPAPTPTQVMARVSAHIQHIAAGTHPSSSKAVP